MASHSLFYKPYESESEYEESEYSTDYESDRELTYDARSAYSSDTLVSSRTFSGPGSEKQTQVIGSGIPADVQLKQQATIEKETYSESLNTTLITISSRDRDTRIYPQPTFFTIRLPKIFKNIRSVNITQINLLNSFFNFSQSKGNTFFYLNELGRTIVQDGVTIQNDNLIQIRNGTYTASELVTELNNAMNQSAIFANISLQSFVQQFQSSGDYTLLFNQPGSATYNSLTGQYDSNLTLSQLIAKYFTVVQTIGTINYSYDECVVAYYYPMIKEMAARNIPFNYYKESLPFGYTDPIAYILFGFAGLDDAYILTLCQDAENQVLFQNFHDQNTFVQFPINQYACSYNTQQGRLKISASGLNTSIQTDLTNQYNQFLANNVSAAGFASVSAFNAAYNNLKNQRTSLIDFYNLIHRNFTNSFGINFGTYLLEFFANLNNEVTLNNTLNRRGWATTITPSVASNATATSITPVPQVSTLLSNIYINPTDPGANNFLCNLGTFSTLTFSNASESAYGYTDISFAILPTSYARLNFTSRCRQTISIMTIPRYINERSPATDEQYFMGPSLTETPMLYDINTSVSPSTVFIRTDISGVPDFNFYTMQQVMFTTKDYMREFDRWITYINPQVLSGQRIQPNNPNWNTNPPLNDIALYSYRPHIFFEVKIDQYVLDPNAKWKVDICVETQDGSLFNVPVVVARFRDRSAFMMDVVDDLNQIYSEDPRHVFEREEFSNVSEAALTIDVLNNEPAYIMVHIANGSSILNSIPLRVFAVLHDDYGVYTEASTLDFRRMPFANLPPLADQFTPNSDVYKSPLTSIYDSSVFQLAYDISGVSNNWLDYFIQSSDNTFFDPRNIQTYQNVSRTGLRYLFDFRTNGSTAPAPDSTAEWSLYFGSGSSNLIRDTYSAGSSNIYLSSLMVPKLPATDNESLLVNWFRASSNATEEYQNPLPGGVESSSTIIGLSTGIFLACYNKDFNLQTDVSTSIASADTTGFSGLSFFMNPNEIAKMNEIELKFAYIQPSYTDTGALISRCNAPFNITNDTAGYSFYNAGTYTWQNGDIWDDWYSPNRQNVRIGIFNTGDIQNKHVSSISLNDAFLTMTLNKVTQVANYTKQTGTFRTREPEWGTYYDYTVLSNATNIWTNNQNSWQNISVSPDKTPTYYEGSNSHPGYFLTNTRINNYNFLPRGYGVAPSVGYAANQQPYAYTSSFTTDIQNSYTIVPFSYDSGSDVWNPASFYGVSFTRKPQIPNPANAGQAPYYGPPGIFGWSADTASTLQITGSSFYWNMKVAYETLDMQYDPATDLSSFGSYTGIQNEYQDTQLFLYRNTSADLDIRDISTISPYASTTTNVWKWGQESAYNSTTNAAGYVAYDDQSGYNFLSYIHDFTVRPSTVHDYAVHVRGYVPTSQFVTGLRLIGKNYTDFGKLTLSEISSEISDLSGYTPISDSLAYQLLNSTNTAYYSTLINTNDSIRLRNGKFYSHQYADALMKFNDTFKYPAPNGILLGTPTTGFSGIRFYLNDYQDAITQYTTFYSTLTGSLNTYLNVLSTTTGQLQQYIAVKYAGIFPDYAITRTRITDPLPFSLLFNSKLVSPYNTLFDQWGLGWNLGFKKADTPYLTTHVSDTFIRILQDYIYLKLNDEMNLNTIGVSQKEDLALTREPFAENNKYFAKILLNNFAGFCRAAVCGIKEFKPFLGKFDTLSFELIDQNGLAINNTDCDFDIVMELTEVADKDVDKLATRRGQ